MLAFARTAPIDTAYVRRVVDELAAIGSSPVGFRATGAPEDRAVADLPARGGTLDRLDVSGCIALLEWSRIGLPVSEIGLELGLRTSES